MLQNCGTALSREQMKNVKGGIDDFQDANSGGYCGGACNGSAGAWYYSGGRHVSLESCQSDVAAYCPSGHGYCSYCF